MVSKHCVALSDNKAATTQGLTAMRDACRMPHYAQNLALAYYYGGCHDPN